MWNWENKKSEEKSWSIQRDDDDGVVVELRRFQRESQGKKRIIHRVFSQKKTNLYHNYFETMR